MYGFIRVTIGNHKNTQLIIEFLREYIKLFNKYVKITRLFTDGCFDGFHYGHVNAFIQAKEQCDILVLGTHSDQELKRTKGDSLFTYEQRFLMLKHCKLIDELVDNVDYCTNVKTLDMYNCNKYIHSREELRILDDIDPLYEIKKSNRYTTFELTKGISTTNLIFRIYQYVNDLDIQYNNDIIYLNKILDKINIPNNNQYCHFLYHSWDLLCEHHINFLVDYKNKNNNASIVACVSEYDLENKNIYSTLERAIIICSIKEIDYVIIESECNYKENWIHIDIPFNKNEYIQLLYQKINTNSNLSRKLMKSLRNSAT
jgi:cytidyltransferase-like protein